MPLIITASRINVHQLTLYLMTCPLWNVYEGSVSQTVRHSNTAETVRHSNTAETHTRHRLAQILGHAHLSTRQSGTACMTSTHNHVIRHLSTPEQPHQLQRQLILWYNRNHTPIQRRSIWQEILSVINTTMIQRKYGEDLICYNILLKCLNC